MTQDSAPRLDPRFSPEFQRGFDPARTGSAASEPTPVFVPHETPIVHPVASPPAGLATPPVPVSAPPVSDSGSTESAQVVTAGGVEDAGSTGFASLRASARNPFLIALAALGALFTVAGVRLFYIGSEEYRTALTSPDSTHYVTSQIALDAASPVLVVGLLILAGVLAILAFRWRSAS
jgi:hypothetical protein